MRLIINSIRDVILGLISYSFRIFPLQNKVVGLAFSGRRYADNPKFIIEEILNRDKNIQLFWVKHPDYEMNVPTNIQVINKRDVIRILYCYATAKVLITNDCFPRAIKKRKGQIVINTWHGGLGIKKIGYESKDTQYNGYLQKHILYNNNLADVFISNSNHLSKIYRDSFKYNGPIWKCGYPKNDDLLSITKCEEAAKRVKQELSIPLSTHILIYAPTYRAKSSGGYDVNMSYYDLDYARLYDTLKHKLGGEWCILIKFHPDIQSFIPNNLFKDDYCIDVTLYNNMQDLIMASDVLISDYSSCLFDAALARVYTFIYANDYENYKQTKGVYYEMEELPFSYSKNNDELVYNIENYNAEVAESKWKDFCSKMGLKETGHSARDIVDKIQMHLNGETVIWENTDI